MSLDFRVIIPARFSSSRLPGKPLLKIGDKTLIEHVYIAACSSDAKEVIIATDDVSIENVATDFGARVIMTSTLHKSGTDRLAEAVNLLGYADDVIVVNIQGDEFGLEAEMINTVANSLHKYSQADMTSLCEKIADERTYNDTNSVKVVLDKDNFALYFSRSPIPWVQHPNKLSEIEVLKHIGIYAYNSAFLKTYSGLPRTMLENQESLEQLRALYFGHKIYLDIITNKKGIEINTEEDLLRARKEI